MNGQKLNISLSSIGTYLYCPGKFKHQYIDNIKIQNNKSNKHLALGLSVHGTLASLNNCNDLSVLTFNDVENLLIKNWIKDGYESIKEEEQYYEIAVDMLLKYFNNPKDQGVKTLLVEKKMNLNCGTYNLIGKIDKAYTTSEDKIEIIDYKTGKSVYGLNNLMIPIYATLFKAQTGLIPDYISYYFLRENKKVTKQVTEDLVEDLRESLDILCNHLVTCKEFKGNFNKTCETSCQYINLCKIMK